MSIADKWETDGCCLRSMMRLLIQSTQSYWWTTCPSRNYRSNPGRGKGKLEADLWICRHPSLSFFFLFVTPFTSSRCIFILLIIPAVGSVCLAARPTQRFNAKNTWALPAQSHYPPMCVCEGGAEWPAFSCRFIKAPLLDTPFHKWGAQLKWASVLTPGASRWIKQQQASQPPLPCSSIKPLFIRLPSLILLRTA